MHLSGSMRSFAFVAVCLFTASCGPSGRIERPPTSGEEDTTLGASDVFDVRVFGEEELSGTYRVAQDGTIDYPFIGRMEVAGLEPYEIADLVEGRLRDDGYLVNPQVSVFVQEYNSKRISVLGAVRNPGSFPMQSGLTVVQAISLAGGFTSLANRDGTTVSRRVSGETRRFAVPVDAITSGREGDFAVQAQDIIYVPERIF
ncbi:Capsular polysaccharide synthesis enzyme CpsC, polysaccharide export [Sandaracinus amylolyticus]|nr:Capsular polysaccharide synthesis enzyme CpsC, polysaccharide export [Sandaracinus amylolyticus]